MNIKNTGIVGIVISGLLLIFGIYKYNYCISMFKASGYITTLWKDKAGNYKIIIIVCAVILLVSVILLISSLLNNENNKNNNIQNSTKSKLQELEQIYKQNLITEEEYENKRKEILDKL